MLNELRDSIHKNALEHGFYEVNPSIDPLVIDKLLLIHSEIGETTEAYRTGHFANIDKYNKAIKIVEDLENNSDTRRLIFESEIKDSFEDEIADTIIRLLDLCGYLEIDVDKHIELKHKYNKARAYKHGKAF